jgi:hypothetical protein
MQSVQQNAAEHPRRKADDQNEEKNLDVVSA